ncbi:MAG: LPP20 family lipoprotein [Treponema sp.]|jgi:hypothetical protein|nr:LPP20 family lipoprotein [Treponema sp.]
MFLNTRFVLCLLFCAEVVFAQSLDRAQAAADDAVRRLEEALGGTTAVQTTRGGTRPLWINNPYSAYPRDRFLAAVGTAANRADAEKRAFAALTAFFGQSIRTDSVVASTYSEAINNNIISFSENTYVREIIVTAASMDTLIGAEIGQVWDDGRGTIYAIAYIELEKAAAVYTELILMNQRNIDNLLAMSTAQRNTFDGYARYKLASLIAGLNVKYAAIVSLIGGANASFNVTDAGSLLLEASNIIKNISVSLNVRGDRNNRVRDAFAGVLSGEGLRTQGNNAPYVLEVSIEMSETAYPGDDVVFCSYTISANLTERATGSVLLPFNVSGRDGQTTYEAAQTRAFYSMERVITERYLVLFREYLAVLMPQ